MDTPADGILCLGPETGSRNQTGQQLGKPVFGPVVFDRHRQRLPLADQHDQFLAQCDAVERGGLFTDTRQMEAWLRVFASFTTPAAMPQIDALDVGQSNPRALKFIVTMQALKRAE